MFIVGNDKKGKIQMNDTDVNHVLVKTTVPLDGIGCTYSVYFESPADWKHLTKSQVSSMVGEKIGVTVNPGRRTCNSVPNNTFGYRKRICWTLSEVVAEYISRDVSKRQYCEDDSVHKEIAEVLGIQVSDISQIEISPVLARFQQAG